MLKSIKTMALVLSMFVSVVSHAGSYDGLQGTKYVKLEEVNLVTNSFTGTWVRSYDNYVARTLMDKGVILSKAVIFEDGTYYYREFNGGGKLSGDVVIGWVDGTLYKASYTDGKLNKESISFK